MSPETIALAQRIWDYHHVNHNLQPADCIMVLGSHDLRVAERGAELWLQGYAPWLLFAGGLGRLTLGLWQETEAEKFAKVAMQLGVPEEKILVESRSTNTGENVALSYQLLQQREIKVNRFILVQKPYMERRTLATFEKQWPGPKTEILVTSPQINFLEYPNEDVSMEEVISIMVGDLQRIKIYPEKGFQTYQPIPAEVWEAYEKLVAKGYTSHLISE
ncbi:MAG: YdcF family protein [Bacteroidota bacterium]|nr:YdcF family protein [Bacteroidota bacterium]